MPCPVLPYLTLPALPWLDLLDLTLDWLDLTRLISVLVLVMLLLRCLVVWLLGCLSPSLKYQLDLAATVDT